MSVHAQNTHAPPCGLTAFEPEDWAGQPFSDTSFNFEFEVFTGINHACSEYGSAPNNSTYVFTLVTLDDDDKWTIGGGFDIGAHSFVRSEETGNTTLRFFGAISVHDDDLRDFVRTAVRTGDLRVMAHFEVVGRDIYVYNDVYKSDVTHVDLRDHRFDLLTILQRQPANSTSPEFAEFLFSNTRFLAEPDGNVRKTYQSPPSWSDIDHDAPFCNLTASVYSSCTAKNNVLTVTDSEGTITSYTLSVFRDRTNDTAIRLYSRTYDADDAESGEYGDETTITTDITCDDAVITLTDETERHRHLPTLELKQACRWVADNVDRNVHNTFLAW